MEAKDIEILYINKKNNKRCDEWYSMLNIDREFTPEEQTRFDKLNEEFGGKAFVFSEFPASDTMINEAKRNEVMMAFGMVTNYHTVTDKERRFFKRRFRYMFEL